jgi:hypothetical protein
VFFTHIADSLIGGGNAQKPPGVETDVLGKISTIQRFSFVFKKTVPKNMSLLNDEVVPEKTTQVLPVPHRPFISCNAITGKG